MDPSLPPPHCQLPRFQRQGATHRPGTAGYGGCGWEQTRGHDFRALDLQARLWSVHVRNYEDEDKMEAVNEKAPLREGVDRPRRSIRQPPTTTTTITLLNKE
ncbi:unnamed protein product [Gadus morhua 'NCC']